MSYLEPSSRDVTTAIDDRSVELRRSIAVVRLKTARAILSFLFLFMPFYGKKFMEHDLFWAVFFGLLSLLQGFGVTYPENGD